MFYKQFSTIIDILNSDFVENFDYWLATLPRNNQKNITASAVSSRLGVKYSMAESILKFAEKQHILESYYLVKCPDCDYNLDTITKEKIADVLINPVFCDECEENKKITLDDIYTAYRVIQQADVSEEDVARAIMSLVEDQCVKEGICKEDLRRGHLIISDDGSYSFEVDPSDGDAYGYNMHNIIYAMNKLRKKNNTVFTMIVFAEELVHFIWPELTESKTKLKVIEILKPEIPKMSVELLEAFGISMEDY